jgi:predicted nucleotidyltransferase
VNSFSLKSIDELPLSVRPRVTEFANKLLENFRDNVTAMLVYGSAAGVNYVEGASNINLAVIVKELDLHVLDQALDFVKRGRKLKIAPPLFLTKEYILNSLDVFPIEFSEIKQRHKLIFGEDVFSSLDIPRKDVKLLCEQQIKGKLLHLRQAYLECGGNPFVLKKALTAVFVDLVPVFRQIILLKGGEPVEHKEGMLRQLAAIFSLDIGPLLAVYHDKNKKLPISSHQVEAHLQNFLNQLDTLSRHLDSL